MFPYIFQYSRSRSFSQTFILPRVVHIFVQLLSSDIFYIYQTHFFCSLHVLQHTHLNSSQLHAPVLDTKLTSTATACKISNHIQTAKYKINTMSSRYGKHPFSSSSWGNSSSFIPAPVVSGTDFIFASVMWIYSTLSQKRSSDLTRDNYHYDLWSPLRTTLFPQVLHL